MNTTDKIIEIKKKLKVYQETDEYKIKCQFDLKFKNDDDPVGIYTYEDELGNPTIKINKLLDKNSNIIKC